MYVIFIFHPSSLALKSRNLGAKGVNGCRLARRYRLIFIHSFAMLSFTFAGS